MHVVFLAGGIASGKSTVARELEARGAHRVDLDQVSRDVSAPGSEVCERLAKAFGQDILDPRSGALRRGLLARRAFATQDATRTLESIVQPAIRSRLANDVIPLVGKGVCVIEVPLLDRVEDLVCLADEVVCVLCPYDVRRERAVARGMDERDFEARAARQPSEAYLRAHATRILENDKDEDALWAQLDAWWSELVAKGRDIS